MQTSAPHTKPHYAILDGLRSVLHPATIKEEKCQHGFVEPKTSEVLKTRTTFVISVTGIKQSL